MVRFSVVILSVALRSCYFLVLRWACRCRWWVLYTQKAKACGATKTHPHPLAETKRCTPMRRKIHGPDATPNLLPCLWPAVAAVLASHPTAPAIAQKCPQASAMGCREAAARGCPRRQQCGLGFVQVSCPLEHTSNPAASVCLLPMPACNLPSRLLLSIANCHLFRVVHYMHLGWFRGPTHVHVQHKDTHTEQRGCLTLQHRQ